MSIFVSIASYRDSECSMTLLDLYKNATNPLNIFTGICQQNDSKIDSDCIPDDFKYKSNVRIIRIPSNEARGPTKARYYCSTLYNNEMYYMQIDSHTRFVKGWDSRCLNMINSLENVGIEKIVLSYYPKQFGEKDSKMVPRICKSFFNERNMISFEGAQLMEQTELPTPNAYIAAGFFFCKGTFLQELPFDPELDYIFVGEEILHSIRFYTHGWNIYSPNKDIVFHEYTRAEKPKIWTDLTYSDLDAFNKIKYLLGIDTKNIVKNYLLKNIDKYGIGNTRTIQDYYEYTGITLNSKTVDRNFCDSTGYTIKKIPSNYYVQQPNFKYSNITLIIIIILVIISSLLIIYKFNY